MTHDPTRLAEGLAERLAAIEAKYHRTSHVTTPDDYEDPDLDELRGAGMAAMRDAQWSRIVPQRFYRARLADFTDPTGDGWHPTLAGNLTAWCDAPRGRNLVIVGPVGTGKTHAAVAAARELHDQGGEVRFLPVIEMLDMLRPGGPEDALYDLADVGTLVLDDVGQERATDWTTERMYALINRRWMEERPIIATSNLPPTRRVAPEGYDGPTLQEAIGDRCFSRLVGSGSVVVRLAGDDRRRARRQS